jgi:DNA-binding response OmpR family regulator
MQRAISTMNDILHPAGLPRCVLVVDHNRDAADSLGALIGLLGHEVLVAYDAMQALALAQARRPHLVLMDLGLPGMSAQSCTRQLRAQDWARHLLLIALTGRGQAPDRSRSRDAAFDRYLVKPVSVQDLQGILGEAPRSSGVFRQQQ